MGVGLQWGKGQEEERRSKRAGGEGKGDRVGREAEPKGKGLELCAVICKENSV